MRKSTTRLLALLMVLALAVSVLPAAVFATGETESPFAGWSLTLGDQIGVNFYYDIAEADVDTTAVKITVADEKPITVLASDAEQKNGRYVFTTGVAAAQMTDIIGVEMITDETTVHSGTYSIRQYADLILAGEEYTTADKEMVLQMLGYGAAAQEYFGYNNEPEKLANSGYEAQIAAASVPESIESIGISGAVEGIKLYGMSLVFESKVAVRFYYSTEDVSGYTFQSGDVSYEPQQKNGLYYVEVAGINPQNYADVITMQVTDAAANTMTVGYSPLHYIVRKYNANSSDSLKALVQAMYGYYLEAKEYAAENGDKIQLPESFDMNVAGNDLVLAIAAEPESITIQDTDITLTGTWADGKLTIPAEQFMLSTMPSGNLTLKIATAGNDYEVSGQFVWVIHTKDELLAMKSHLVAQEDGVSYDGLLALGADITDTITMGSNNGVFTTDEYFAGTFDGRGHAFGNIVVKSGNKGLFTNVSGKICNLRVLDATVSSNTAPLVGKILTGEMENIYVKGSITKDGMSESSILNNFGCGLLAAQFRNRASVKNVIVEVVSIADNLRLATAFGKMGNYNAMSYVSFENCYAVNANGQVYMNYTTDGTLPVKLDFTQETTGSFDSIAAMWADESASALATALGMVKPTTQIILDKPFDMNVAGNNMELAIAVEPESVIVQGTDITLNGTWADGKLTIPAEQFMLNTMPSGNLTLKIVAAGCDYEVSGQFVWVIHTKDELMAMKSHLVAQEDGVTYDGLLALGADITDKVSIGYSNGVFANSETFNGTFDGRDFAIHSLSVAAGNIGLFTNVSGRICNLRVLDAAVSSYTAPLVGRFLTGEMENIYVKGSITKDGMGETSNLNNFGCGLLAARYQGSASVKNVIVEVVSIADDLRLATAFGKLGDYNSMSKTSFENCYVINAAGQVYMTYEDTPVKLDFTQETTGSFDSIAAMWADEDAAALATALGLVKTTGQIVLAQPFDMNVAGNDMELSIVAEPESITIQGTDITLSGVWADGKLTIPAEQFMRDGMPSGDLTLQIVTPAYDYEVSGEFVWVINTQEELYAMKDHLVVADDGNTYSGSLALGADINPGSGYLSISNSIKFFENTDYFAGTFDGRGHTLTKVFTQVDRNGLFTNVTGTIKNLRLENCYVRGATAALVGGILTGTVEDVYINGTIQNDNLATGGNWTYQGCGLLAAQIKTGASVKNCIVNVKAINEAALEVGTAFGKLNTKGMTEAVFENCYAINAAGAAYMVIDGQAGNKYEFALDVNGSYATLTELQGNVNAAILAAKLGLGKTKQEVVMEQPYDMNVADNALELTIAAAPESITVKNTDITLTGAWADGKLTIPAQQFMLATMPTGNLTLEIITPAYDYEVSGEFIWVINTQEELYAMKDHLVVAEDGKTYTGSLALGADINPGSGYLSINNNFVFFEATDVFAGTFDGRGYTLYKVYTQLARNGLFANVSGTIKNLKMENCYVKNCAAALVGGILTGTVENVYISGTLQDDKLTTTHDWTYQGCGLLAAQIKTGASVKNCIVNVKAINEAALEVGTAFGKLNTNGMTEAVFENCYAINASGAAYMIINGKAGDKYDFTLATNGNFATLADLWNNEAAAALAAALGLTQ